MCRAVVIGRELQVAKLYLFGNVYSLGSVLVFHHSNRVMQTATCLEYLQTQRWSCLSCCRYSNVRRPVMHLLTSGLVVHILLLNKLLHYQSNE